MEISRDALMRVVKAARLACRMAGDIQKLMTEKTWTVADSIFGELADAIYDMLNEKGTVNEFTTSTTYRLLTGDLSDEAVTDFIIMKSRLEHRVREMKNENVDLPSPQIMSKEQFDELYKKNGGYKSTLKGEFS